MNYKTYEQIEDITVEYRHGSGQLRRRQLYKKVLSRKRGGWALILFVWQDWRTKGRVKKLGWQPPRFAIERWRMIGHRWRMETRLALQREDAEDVYGTILDLNLDALVDEAEKNAPPGDQDPGGAGEAAAAEQKAG